MDLHEYPTPLTDGSERSESISGYVEADFARNLEQRLAVCRETLKSLDPGPEYELDDSKYEGVAFCEIPMADVRRLRETLTLTAPQP